MGQQSQREFMKKNCGKESVVRGRSTTMKPNFPPWEYRKMVSGYFSSANNVLCRRKREEKLKSTANAKIPTFTQKRQAAAGKRRKWRENHGHVVTLAVRVSRKHDAN